MMVKECRSVSVPLYFPLITSPFFIFKVSFPFFLTLLPSNEPQSFDRFCLEEETAKITKQIVINLIVLNSTFSLLTVGI